MNAQKYLEENFSNKDINCIDCRFISEKLSGELTIQDYTQIEEINLANHEITSLTIIGCPKLKKLNVRNNLLDRLEIDSKELEEIIAGNNKIASLDLTNFNRLKSLIIPDNSNLVEIKNFNLSNIKELNIINTSLKLGKTDEGLEEENQNLYQALNKINEAVLKRKLIIAEDIRTSRQAEEEIRNLLKELKDKWKEHFYEDGEKDPFLEASLESPEKKRKAQRILIEIIGTLSSCNYEKLIRTWNEGEDYNTENDFDGGSLDRLMQLLKIRTNLIKNEKSLSINVAFPPNIEKYE